MKETTMKAVVWNYSEAISCQQVEKPRIQLPRDAIIKITTSSICGSDLHLYKNTMKEMNSGNIMGHECMGIVEEVGSQLQDNLPIGQRVVVAANIACGNCEYCLTEKYHLCSPSNFVMEDEEEEAQRQLTGHRSYSLLGAKKYPGGQAQFIRVPYADVNCLQISAEIPDEKVVFLSDLFSTAWHGTEVSNIDRESTVAVWGMGPVGLMSMV